MISAAKADGRITPDEQQQVMSRLSNASREAVDFMRQEFSRPLDVKELAWSVPLGMEQKVYTLSLAAVHLDEQSEFSYFRDLAHGLRMEPDFCNEIHQRYGVPNIF